MKHRLAVALAGLMALSVVQIATPAAAQSGGTGIQSDGVLAVSPQVAKVIGNYLTLVSCPK